MISKQLTHAIVLLISLLAWVAATNVSLAAGKKHPAVYGYRVVNTYPHDPLAYTQGLIYHDGFLFESTGINGRSTLRKVKLQTGEVVQQQSLDFSYFAEGLTDWGNQLIQLTWQSNIGFIYDLATFKLQRTFHYAGEGWGITHDKTRLIMSDGSDNLRFLNPDTLQEVGHVVVTDAGIPVQKLNELEYIRGEVYANIWHDDRIARISTKSGHVTGWIDLKGLLPSVYHLDPEAVLNGIAYDATHDRLFVTGKLWPKIFELKIHMRH